MTAYIQQLIAERTALFRSGRREQHKRISVKVERECFLRKRTYFGRVFSAENPDYWRFVKSFHEQMQTAGDGIKLLSELNEGFYSV